MVGSQIVDINKLEEKAVYLLLKKNTVLAFLVQG